MYGVEDVHNFLQSKDIKNGWKSGFNDNLDFSRKTNVNVMTYHSAKGLQFDCVILPFSTYVNTNNGASKLPYVGLTRASRKIIITYTEFVADEYNRKIDKELFAGELNKKQRSSNIDAGLLYLIDGDSKDVELKYIREKMNIPDISDCDVNRLSD